MQQAVKPLGYPRGRVLSREGFQRIIPTKSIKEKEMLVIKFFYFEKGEKYLKYV